MSRLHRPALVFLRGELFSWQETEICMQIYLIFFFYLRFAVNYRNVIAMNV